MPGVPCFTFNEKDIRHQMLTIPSLDKDYTAGPNGRVLPRCYQYTSIRTWNAAVRMLRDLVSHGTNDIMSKRLKERRCKIGETWVGQRCSPVI